MHTASSPRAGMARAERAAMRVVRRIGWSEKVVIGVGRSCNDRCWLQRATDDATARATATGTEGNKTSKGWNGSKLLGLC